MPPSGDDKVLFGFLNQAPAEQVAKALAGEQPLVTGVVLAQLAPPQAAKILATMPAARQQEIVGLMRKGRKVPGEILQTVAHGLKKRFDAPGGQVAPAAPQPRPGPQKWQPRQATPQEARQVARQREGLPQEGSPQKWQPRQATPEEAGQLADPRRQQAMQRALEAANRAKSGKAPPKSAGGPRKIDGMALAAEILRYADPKVRDMVKANDPKLYQNLHRRMFVFDDLEASEADALGKVFSVVDPKVSALALRFASDRLHKRVLHAVGAGRAKLIEDEVAAGGGKRVRVQDIERAQQYVIDVAMKLQQAGKIVIDPESPDLV